MTLRAEVPKALAPLLKPARYKGAHGGRGGAKSHFFAEQVILRAYARPTRVACIREVQNSLKESVRQLLIDKIQKFGLGQWFDVLESEIRAPNGSLIIFRGMQSYNAETIKSLEGYDIAWVEEAQTLSDVSLRMLRPTIRKEGSEIWFSWNPRHDTDAVDRFLRGAASPPNAIVQEVNWNDNPWLPDVLRDEMEHDYAVDPEMAAHVWGGDYEIVGEGAYYAKLLAEAEREGRFGDFPHDPALPVTTAWDIGVADYTAIWFVQDNGLFATVVDYYETTGDGAEQIVKFGLPEHLQDAALRQAHLDLLQRREPFTYGPHFLPHDVRVREWGSGARQRADILRGLGLKNVRKGAAANPADRVQAVRSLLPTTRFNTANERVALGVSRLRRYRRKWNDTLQVYTTPEHDVNSHGADAFGEYAINARIAPPREEPKPQPGEVIYQADRFGRVQANMSVMDIVNAKMKRKRAANG